MEIKVKYLKVDLDNSDVDKVALDRLLRETPAKKELNGTETVTISFTLLEEIPAPLLKVKPIEATFIEDAANTQIVGGAYGGEEKYDTRAFVIPTTYGVHIEARSGNVETLRTYVKKLLKGELTPAGKSTKKESSWRDKETE